MHEVVPAIDVHTHLHPPRLFAAIRRWFAERSSWDLANQPTEPHEVAAVMRADGVERFVFFSYAHKPGMAREVNAWLNETARELGGCGLPLGTIHLDDAEHLEDLRAALDGGCAGIKIHEDVQRLRVDDPRFDRVYAAIAERGGVVLAHVGPIPWSDDTADGPGRVAGVLARHPDLNLIVAHMGSPDTARYFALMDRLPRLRLDTTMAIALGSPMQREQDAPAFERHATRVLYGTDFPNIPYAYPTERRSLEGMGLSEATLRRILHDNAAELFAPFFRA